MARLTHNTSISGMSWFDYSNFTRTNSGRKFIYSMLWIDNRNLQINTIRNIKEIDTGLKSGSIRTYAMNALSMRSSLVNSLASLKSRRNEIYSILND